MLQSNIFAYIELSKFVTELASSSEPAQIKDILKKQVAYFNILEPRFFSDALAPEWETVQRLAGELSQRPKDKGKTVYHVTRETIDALSPSECGDIADKIFIVFQKVKAEFVF